MEHLDNENFDKIVKNSDKPVVIDFWAPWCGPCKMMGPVFEEISNEMNDKAVFCKLNTDEQGDLAGPYGVSGIPTLLVLKDGKEVDRIVGFMPKEALKEKISSLL